MIFVVRQGQIGKRVIGDRISRFAKENHGHECMSISVSNRIIADQLDLNRLLRLLRPIGIVEVRDCPRCQLSHNHRRATGSSRVVFPPCSSGGSVVVLGALAETPVLFALGGETSGLSVLVDGVADPVDSGVTTDGFVIRAIRASAGFSFPIRQPCK